MERMCFEFPDKLKPGLHGLIVISPAALFALMWIDIKSISHTVQDINITITTATAKIENHDEQIKYLRAQVDQLRNKN
jgi:hypothetical protein